MTKSANLSRRDFLKKTAKVGAAGFVVPYIISASALGLENKPGANSRIQLGLIGCNGMGTGNLNNCAKEPDVVVMAACDVWKKRSDAIVAKHKDTCKPHSDFREVLQRKDIDAVIIATPPHWHALVAIMACEAGKDLYLQKPMTMHLGESVAVKNAVKKHNRICQVGTQIHASPNYRRVVELVQSGYLGKIGTIRTFNVMNQGEQGIGHDPNTTVPEGLDWDFWCGPAPLRPYNSILATGSYHHPSFMDYSGGWTPGMAPHIIDLPVWALDLQYPIETTSAGGRFVIKDDGDAYDHHEVLWRYPKMTMTWMSSLTNSYGFDLHGRPEPMRRLGIYFHGVNGTMYANYGEHRIIPEGANFNEFIKPDVAARKQAKDYPNRIMYNCGELKPVSNTIPDSPGHEREWLNSIKSRQLPSCNPEYHCRVDIPIVLSLLSYKLGRTVRFDPKTLQIVGDKEAAKLAIPKYRSPWKFPKQYLNA
ncbi:MAG: Gfo/Idh/MocA family oxidoreductase [Kiritimatiellae bacterium]|nr:Gfo/Idh/MocA family oxidoreductase [Kiritimatiellia bacterium]MDD5523292.1 Gfo/Idh/MocA family oxidoreductase [Kiritimatiellia bacterium]